MPQQAREVQRERGRKRLSALIAAPGIHRSRRADGRTGCMMRSSCWQAEPFALPAGREEGGRAGPSATDGSERRRRSPHLRAPGGAGASCSRWGRSRPGAACPASPSGLPPPSWKLRRRWPRRLPCPRAYVTAATPPRFRGRRANQRVPIGYHKYGTKSAS